MNLDDYLKEAKNSVFREKLVNYRVFYEIKLAAARKQSDIKIYIPEIDRDGYDVVLDDGDRIKPFQLKAINDSSATSEWEVQKSLLRPMPINIPILGFEQSPEGEGTEGGFILVNLMVHGNSIDVFEYYYTDTFIIKAFELGILKYNNSSYEEKIIALTNELRKGSRREKIKLTKSKLVKVYSIDHLLALADLPSIYHNQWQSSFCNYLKNKIEGKVIRNEREELALMLRQLINDRNIIIT